MHVRHTETRLYLSDDDGFAHDFHAFWLRESSTNEEFRDPGTGHKLQDADQLPLDVTIVHAATRSGELELEFSDGHRAVYSLTDLRRAAEHPFTPELIGEKVTWNASLDPLPWHNMEALENDPHKILDLLNDLARLGFVLVRGVPLELNGVLQFIDLIGYMRLTNNGGIQDIKAVGEGRIYDLSMTPRSLEPHVDNPYRVPQPGYVLLHCLRNDAQGGESQLTDGLYVAEKMRSEQPELFDSLCNVPVVFRYADEQATLENTSPFIDISPEGRIEHVRFHGRCDQVIAAEPDKLDAFYRARRTYTDLIKAPDVQLTFKLNPGEMFMVDNFRIIHGRRNFQLETGARHMRQAYIDRDVVSSRQKTLLRNIDAKPPRPRQGDPFENVAARAATEPEQRPA
ncbi:MAG TPA: TauD/TfdA family dioxygenase [Woeseiaceae bacterium]|nr:TauD/TfdA family dioxygenase [Woeseiaceae bacterium]